MESTMGGIHKLSKRKHAAETNEALLGRTVSMSTRSIRPTTSSLLSVLVHIYLWRGLSALTDACGRPRPAGLSSDRAMSLAGRLQWQAEATMQGRLRLSKMWRAAGRSKAWHARQVLLCSFAGLEEELQWWLKVCESDSLTLVRIYSPAQAAALRVGAASQEAAAAGARVSRSDAGATGGAVLVDGKLILVVFSAKEATWSSQARELLPLVRAAELLGAGWKGKLIVFVVDNSSVAFDINKCRASSPVSRVLLGRLFQAADVHQFEVLGIWVSRAHNTVMDAAAAQLSAEQLAAFISSPAYGSSLASIYP